VTKKSNNRKQFEHNFDDSKELGMWVRTTASQRGELYMGRVWSHFENFCKFSKW